MIVGEGRPDHDVTDVQCDDTTVRTIKDENADVTNANTDDENADVEEQGDHEQNTWIQVVDRRKRKRNKSNQIVSRSALSRNNPVI